ncbi:MAG: molybdopterin biosynthesis protein, partial [Thermodesulfobacteriota bacterium]
MSGRNIYLTMTSANKAREVFLARFSDHPRLDAEELFAADAAGRVLIEPVYARFCSPSFHAAAMDGIAVTAEKTFGASEKKPLDLTIGREAFYVNTGGRIPAQTDAVIMIEDVVALGEGVVRIEKAAYPWQHVRKVGEDIVATEMLFPRNHLVRPSCVNALLAAGAFRVKVKKKPRVLLIPTGDELLPWEDATEEALSQGKVVESNSYMLEKMVELAGGTAERTGIVPDRMESLGEAVAKGVAAGHDLVLVLAGSSAGSHDHTKNVLSSLGEVLVHGVSLMPGKPVILADVKDVPVVGVPGYPVSAIVAFSEFVEPILCRMLGVRPEPRPSVSAVPTRKVPSRIGMEELVRVKLGRVGDTLVATPLPRGAGSITSFVRADGVLRVAENREGLPAGEPVQVSLLPTDQDVSDTIVIVGSHDNTLDLITDLVKERDPRFGLSSAHVGSMGGLMAVKKGICHAAGTHLLDTSDGSYNLSYIKKVLPGVPVHLI